MCRSLVPPAGKGLLAHPSGVEMKEAPRQSPTSKTGAVAPGLTSREEVMTGFHKWKKAREQFSTLSAHNVVRF